ncbi:hypothetical protein [Microcystis sp. M53602_WE12]|uniref:hypothetical protein n=1 Tax=Microcystis sp. M53602_WE12 TaxID=3030674 RepID=UPI00258CF510|nr:hypothetical protein [Microcystis sp. M53602_WE12]MDJ0604118.1 hypothetical protein [Microcystis sp. M53602_WE12]
MPHLLRFLSHNIHKLLHAYISYQLSVISCQPEKGKSQKAKGKSMVNLSPVSESPVSFVLFVTFSLKNVS